MNWHRVAGVSLDKNMAPLSQYLHQQRITHRISEENDQQVIWVCDEGMVLPVRQLVDQWLDNRVTIEVIDRPAVESGGDISTHYSTHALQVLRTWRQVAITSLLLTLSVLGAILVEFDEEIQWVHWLTFQEFGVDAFKGAQWWRLITPIFLHFGLLHIVFNGLWLWELGRRIERLHSGWFYGLFVLGTGMISNLVQYSWAGPSIFGGMSGVIYAFLGYIWVRQRYRPDPLLVIAPGIIIIMLVWLIICMMGIVDLFIGGKIANAAHVGGLLSGMAIGYVVAMRR